VATDRDRSTFEDIDWTTVDPDRSPATRDLLAIGLFLALGALFAYDYLVASSRALLLNESVLGHRLRWEPTGFDWLVLLSLCLFLVAVVAPLATNRSLARRYWRRLRSDRLAVAALAYLGLATVLAVLGPVVLGEATVDAAPASQPPAFTTVDGRYVLDCVGPEVGTEALPKCQGTLQYPLGTDRFGQRMLPQLAAGLRVSLSMALVASMLMIPVATAVGTVAGYAGGRVDDLLMRYVDVQQTVPAVLVYLILVFLFSRSLFLIVLVFGLLSWGGVARMVRSEVLKRTAEPYVAAARAAGASHVAIVRRHLLPNVSNTVVTAVTIQIPTLILAEAALAFLGIGERYSNSLGQLIEVGLTDFQYVPWIAMEAAIALALTALAFNVLGDALRDATQPDGGER
jgi:peptide/nickel transport system permease protein